MPVCAAAMEELVCELRLFLDLLDREYLSAGVRERKLHLSNILHRVLSDKGECYRHAVNPSPSAFALRKVGGSPSAITVPMREGHCPILTLFLLVLHVYEQLGVCPSSPEPSFKSEIHSGLPAPPQMPLPEIPHPWLVRLHFTQARL